MVVWVRIEWNQINKSGDNSGSFVSRGVLWIMSNKFSGNVRQTPPSRFIDRPRNEGSRTRHGQLFP